LHKLALRGSLVFALPVLRRLLRAGLFPATTLPQLHRSRESVRRKHLLRMLAIESGYRSWEEFVPALEAASAADLPFVRALRVQASQLNLWFPSQDSASEFARQHGGEVIPIGSQAVVVPAERGA
jgi:hypothetical protein